MHGTFTTLTPSEGYGVDFSGHGFAILYTGQYAYIDNAKVLASHQFYAVLRYSITQSCTFDFSAKLVLGITSTGQNTSIEFDLLMEKQPERSGKTWRSPQTVTLLTGKVYNLSLTYNSTNEIENCSVHVDSLVFLPDVNTTRAYIESERDTQDQLHSCAQASLSLAASEPAYCNKLVFAASTEIYNGTLGKFISSLTDFSPFPSSISFSCIGNNSLMPIFHLKTRQKLYVLVNKGRRCTLNEIILVIYLIL